MSELSLNVETGIASTDKQASHKDDGFFATLEALRQVLTPTTQQQTLVQLLQKEKQDLNKQIDTLRTETQQQIQLAQQVMREKAHQHAEEKKEWEQRLREEKERANEKCKELEVQLAHQRKQLEDLVQEKEAAAAEAREEIKGLEDSMIVLESENKTLKDRCEQSETTRNKLQTELNERTTAAEQSNIALAKIGKLLDKKESSVAEINKYKQKMNDALSTTLELKYKLQQAERELSSLKTKMTLEAAEQESPAEFESKLQQVDGINNIASLEQELVTKNQEYSTLQEKMKEETANLRNNLEAKNALLVAKEKMLTLVTTKVEKLQTKEKDAAAKHAAEIISLKEEWEETKEELQCAEEEVARCRTRIQELELQAEQSKRQNLEATGKSIVPGTHEIADTVDTEKKANHSSSGALEETKAGPKKRKAAKQDAGGSDAPPEELDSIKAKLLAKKHRSKQP